MLERTTRRTTRHAVWCALALVLLSGCGGGDGEGSAGEARPSPTRSVERPEPTETEAPTDDARPTLPPITRDPDDEETEPEEPVREPEEPSETREPEPPAEEETQQEEAQPTESDAEETDDTADETPAWVWWLLAAIIVSSLTGIAVWVVRSRRKRRWLAALRPVEDELRWFAFELLPDLRRSASLDQVVGGWKVGAPRVAAAEDQLTVLESSAPSDADRSRARTLRDAARLASQRLDALAVVAPHDSWALDLDELAADLEVALGPVPPPGAAT